MAFENGHVFNGQTFDQKTFYSIDGLFSFEATGSIDSIISLQNKYVILPYAEAHHHNRDDYDTEEKKLGLIEDCYIANFLVLEENPLDNFENFQKISMLVKEGKIIKSKSSKE